jgi:hypothetical protein
MPLFHHLMDGPILMDPGPTCSRQASLQIFLVPGVSTQIPLACTDLRPQSPSETSLAIWTKCPVVPWLGCIPRSWATTQQPGGQKWHLLSLPFPANASEMLQAMVRETKSLRPLCRKQEFYYTSRLRGDDFSNPWALIGVRRWVIIPPRRVIQPGVFAVYGSQEVRKKSQLQRNKLVAVFLPSPPTECGHSHRKPCRA